MSPPAIKKQWIGRPSSTSICPTSASIVHRLCAPPTPCILSATLAVIEIRKTDVFARWLDALTLSA
jgi:hypothetical protein